MVILATGLGRDPAVRLLRHHRPKLKLGHHSTGTPYTKSVKMATRTRKAKASLLDDRIDILDRSAVEVSPAKQVFKTVSTTLALVRVSTPFCIHLWAI